MEETSECILSPFQKLVYSEIETFSLDNSKEKILIKIFQLLGVKYLEFPEKVKYQNEIFEISRKFQFFCMCVGNGMVYVSKVKITLNIGNLGEKIRERFVRDFGFPILALKSPHFEYLVDLYNSHLQTNSKVQLLIDVINTEQWDEQQFLDYTINLEVDMGKQLCSTEAYKTFIDDKDSQYQTLSRQIPKIPEIPESKWIYKDENDGKYFISIDLICANFQALKYLSPDLVLGCGCWEDLVGKFTKFEYFKKAKHFRQQVFGHLDISLKGVWKYFMNKIVIVLLDVGLLKVDEIAHKGGDELVISTTIEEFPEKASSMKTFLCSNLTDCEVKVEAFFLKKYTMQRDRKEYNFWVKEIFTDWEDLSQRKFALKCVYPTGVYIHAFKYYLKLEEKECDSEIEKIGPPPNKLKNKKRPRKK